MILRMTSFPEMMDPSFFQLGGAQTIELCPRLYSGSRIECIVNDKKIEFEIQ